MTESASRHQRRLFQHFHRHLTVRSPIDNGPPHPDGTILRHTYHIIPAAPGIGHILHEQQRHIHGMHLSIGISLRIQLPELLQSSASGITHSVQLMVLGQVDGKAGLGVIHMDHVLRDLYQILMKIRILVSLPQLTIAVAAASPQYASLVNIVQIVCIACIRDIILLNEQADAGLRTLFHRFAFRFFSVRRLRGN